MATIKLVLVVGADAEDVFDFCEAIQASTGGTVLSKDGMIESLRGGQLVSDVHAAVLQQHGAPTHMMCVDLLAGALQTADPPYLVHGFPASIGQLLMLDGSGLQVACLLQLTAPAGDRKVQAMVRHLRGSDCVVDLVDMSPDEAVETGVGAVRALSDPPSDQSPTESPSTPAAADGKVEVDGAAQSQAVSPDADADAVNLVSTEHGPHANESSAGTGPAIVQRDKRADDAVGDAAGGAMSDAIDDMGDAGELVRCVRLRVLLDDGKGWCGARRGPNGHS
eukprot:6179443-Pleurochrysis_carterae.AAC.3